MITNFTNFINERIATSDFNKKSIVNMDIKPSFKKDDDSYYMYIGKQKVGIITIYDKYTISENDGFVLINNKSKKFSYNIDIKNNEVFLLDIDIHKYLIGKGYGKILIKYVFDDLNVDRMFLQSIHNHKAWEKVGEKIATNGYHDIYVIKKENY